MGSQVGETISSRLLAGSVLTGGAAVALTALLGFARDFDIATSPAWQVALHHALAASLLALTLTIAPQRPYGCPKLLPAAMLVMALLLPAATFAVAWKTGGAYTGPRDPRIFDTLIVSTAAYIAVWIVLVATFPIYFPVRDILRWRGREEQDAKIHC